MLFRSGRYCFSHFLLVLNLLQSPVMPLFPGAFNIFSRFQSSSIPKNCLDRLPNDVLVDEILDYLDIIHVLRMRRVRPSSYAPLLRELWWHNACSESHRNIFMRSCERGVCVPACLRVASCLEARGGVCAKCLHALAAGVDVMGMERHMKPLWT